VRLLTGEDVNEVYAVHLLLFQVKYSRQTIESFLVHKYLSLILVDVTDGSHEKIVGVSISFREWVSMCSTQRRAYLSTFGILPEYRNQGLGTYLFGLTCHILRVHYCVGELSLHMLQSNVVSYKFYERLGMHATRVLPEYYNFDNSTHTAVYMRRELIRLANEVARPDISHGPDIDQMLRQKEHIWFLAQLICEP
jgi:ribosomal protein S18 acetylase RimI-like enzyme